MAGWLRPYPMATAGTLLFFDWDRKSRQFRFRFRADPSVKGPTEIFAPPECFGGAAEIVITPHSADRGAGLLRAEYLPGERRIFIHNDGLTGEADIIVRPGP
jgi:hypothetical protein